ncbi:MAG: hypothetical protein ACYCXR_04095 [Coriobacteriia bacterium]
MTHSDRTKRILIVTAIVVAVLALLAIAWMLRPEEPVDPGMSEADETTVSTTAPDPEDVGTMESTAPSESTVPGAETTPIAPGAPIPSERVPAVIVSARIEGGATILVVDYIQFLTGEEAAIAAADRGDESPPPNDYYIVNDNTRLREFTVQDGISVVTVVQDDGTSDPGGHTLPLADWVARLSGPAADAFKSSFYWLTVSGETITTVEQQYLP